MQFHNPKAEVYVPDGIAEKEAFSRTVHGLTHPLDPVLVAQGPCQEKVFTRHIDLAAALPLPHLCEKDRNPYVSVGVLVAKRHTLRLQAQASREQILAVARHKWGGVWPWVLINGLAGQTLGVSCMQWALETTPTGIVLAIIAMTPVAVIPVALLIEGEKPTKHSIVGAIIAVTGVIGLIAAGKNSS